MGRTGGKATKEKILKTAEQLFAEKGFDAASVDEIAAQTGVNKALIYYHFKNKDDLKKSLYKRLSDEVVFYVSKSIDSMHREKDRDGLEAIKEVVNFLTRKKEILSMLLMESIKEAREDDQLFEVSKIVIESENNGIKAKLDQYEKGKFDDTKKLLVHEFFTGFIPLILFTVLKDRFGTFFNFDQDELLDYFLTSFKESHLSNHNLEKK